MADQVLDAVADRMAAPRTAATEVNLAGYRIGSSVSSASSNDHPNRIDPAEQEAGEESRIESRIEAERLALLAERLGDAAIPAITANGVNYVNDRLFGSLEERQEREAEKNSSGITSREMLTGSSFLLSAGSAGGAWGHCGAGARYRVSTGARARSAWTARW